MKPPSAWPRWSASTNFCEKNGCSRTFTKKPWTAFPAALQKQTPGGESAWWLPSITVEHIPVPELQEALRERGVPTRRIFSPLHTYPYLLQHALFACPNAERIYEQGLNLPASTANDEESVRRAAEIVRDVLLEKGGRA